MKNFLIGLVFVLGLSIGSLVSLHAEHEKYSRVFDKNGTAIKVGDVILGDNGAVIKVHGFTSTYKAGTYAAYDYQVQACPTCNWVETVPASGVVKNAPAFEKNPGVFAKVLNYFDLLAADGDSIIWGS